MPRRLPPEERSLSFSLCLARPLHLRPSASLERGHTSEYNISPWKSKWDSIRRGSRRGFRTIRSGAGSETARYPRLSALANSGNSILRVGRRTGRRGWGEGEGVGEREGGLIEKRASLTQYSTAAGFPENNLCYVVANLINFGYCTDKLN